MLNDVDIQEDLTGLNRPAPVTDSISLLVAGGVSIVEGEETVFQYNTPYLFNGIEDAEAIGITQDYDTDNNILLWYHINKLFNKAPGQPLWVYIVSQSMPQTVMWDITSPNGVQDALNQLNGVPNGGVKLIATVLNPLNNYEPVINSNIDDDVLTAIPKAQQLAVAMFNARRAVDCIIEGRSFGATVKNGISSANTYDLNQFNMEKVNVVVGQDLAISGLFAQANGYADIGTYLGMAASKYYSDAEPDVSLADSPAEVGLELQGNIQDATDGFFLTYGMANTALKLWSLVDQGTIEALNYVSIRIFPNTTGVYFTQSSTCANQENDLIRLELSRVYNKAMMLLYVAYVPYINKKFAVDKNGFIPGPMAKALEDVGNQVFNGNSSDPGMVGRGECSGGSTSIDPKQTNSEGVPQSIILTKTLVVKWKVIPEGKIEAISGTLQFTVSTS